MGNFGGNKKTTPILFYNFLIVYCMYPRTRVATGATLFFLSLLKLQNPSWYIITESPPSSSQKQSSRIVDCHNTEFTLTEITSKFGEYTKKVSSKTLHLISLLIFSFISFSYFFINYFTDFPFKTYYFIILFITLIGATLGEVLSVFAIKKEGESVKVARGIILDVILFITLITMYMNKYD